ncbi:MAG: nuclear transport factor 2 family protein [Pseudomonadota bacterium]
MSIEQLAKDFTQAVKDDDAEAYQSFWSDDIVSLEPDEGEMSRVEGRDALLAKHAWWEENAELHSVTTEGPYVFGDQFAIRYYMDMTMFGERSQSGEVGLYTVKDDKIVEERFLYGTTEE